MASGSGLGRSGSRSRANLISKDLRTLMNESPDYNSCNSGPVDFGVLRDWDRKVCGLSRRIIRGVSVRWRWRKRRGNGGSEADRGERNGTSSVSRCLSFYSKGGGCRVGSCEEFEIDQGRKSSVTTEECVPQCPLPIIDGGGLECLSHGVSEMFWKMSSPKGKETEQHRSCASSFQFSLPDDILEMCLVRLPLESLMRTRLVCKRWRMLTTTPHFMQMRLRGCYRTPWLFLFGIIKDRTYGGEIYALDICLDRWHKITIHALRGRFLFSVATVGTDLYVVGGCSSLNRHGHVAGRNSLKTHKEVLVFSPLTGSWSKAASMRSARSGAILGVFEVGSSYAVPHRQSGRQEIRDRNSRIRGVSDVYEDPHRCSLRRQLMDIFPDTEELSMSNKKLHFKPVKVGEKKHVLIAVGGHGSWDEPLDSGEIYDPITDRWTQIAKLPADFGAVCSGAACSGVFYVYSEADKLAGYNLNRGIWVAIQTSRIPPRIREYHPKLVSCENRLFMLSVLWSDRDGQPNRREKAVRKLWELDPTLPSWIEASRHPDAPMDWSAAFVGNGDNIYGVEMFKVFGQVLDFITVCSVSAMELKWSRISKKHATYEADASSCMAKAVAVVQL